MKVFDCFTFFNELELLEFRLKFLNDFVDFFVIAESNLTFNGKPKPYNYPKAKERFKKWEHKIIYIPVQQNTEGLVFKNDNNYNPVSAAWKLENGQRNALMQASKQMDDADLVLVSDLDEIPDPAVLKKLNHSKLPAAFSLLFHYYYMNCQNTGESRWWNGCVAATARQFKEITPQGLRNNRDVYPSVAAAGWHFSFLGGAEKISYKIRSYAHTEYNKEEFFDETHIEDSILKGTDVLKRKGVFFKFMPLSFYPFRLQHFMKMYPGFLHPDKTNALKDIFYFIRRIKKRSF
ncbi:MAG: hypothetical protein IPP96_01985 [Chitinophagaceae bacterium]|nr:hypothetical protein [Chitinophagaceae bacterium]